jgi:hypothetical protein
MASLTLTDEQLAQNYGYRDSPGRVVILDEPSELGYRCPRGHSMGQITWSEFKDHIWCCVCNKDYHYADDCRMMRPCWESQKEFLAFVNRLPKKPRILKGIMHYPDCEIPHKKHKFIKKQEVA